MLKPASFLDRDGVINIDKGYVHKIEDFEWVLGAKEAIKYLNQNNYFVIVVSNQSGIARNYYSENDVLRLHEYINNELHRVNAKIDDFYFSPYHPEIENKYSHLANLRKPNTGMLENAERKWNFNKKDSFMIGDKESDIICAKNFGIKGYKFTNGDLCNFVKQIVDTSN